VIWQLAAIFKSLYDLSLEAPGEGDPDYGKSAGGILARSERGLIRVGGISLTVIAKGEKPSRSRSSP
jgi:hypothetical protein